MDSNENRRRGQNYLAVPLGLLAALLALFAAPTTSQGKSKSKSKSKPMHAEEVALAAPASTPPAPMEATGESADAVYIFVKGSGVLRMRDGAVSTVLPTQASLRDLQVDSEGALWASLHDVGVLRMAGGRSVTLTPESFAKLAIRTPTDVWTINDSHGSVVHYDGQKWKTARTRNSLAGAFDDNRLLDIVTDGRAVWVSSWNGLWRVVGGRWTRVEAPPAAAVAGDPDPATDGQAPPAYPLSLLVARPGLVACYLAGCQVYSEAGWRPSHWSVEKAHLQSAGPGNVVAGTGADGRTVVIAHLDGSGEPGKSEALPPTGINDIAIDSTGRVWVATGPELFVLDASGRTLQRWKTGASGSPAGDIERVIVEGAGPARLPAN